MIQFSIEDIATPGAAIEHTDVWATIKACDAADLKRRLKALPYQAGFLKTPYWRAVATAVKQRDGFKCRLCWSGDRPEVHHPGYLHLGEDHLHMDVLLTLCHPCHSKHHDKPGAPAYAPSPGKGHKKKRNRAKRFAERREAEVLQHAAALARKIKEDRVKVHADSMKTYAVDNRLSMDDLLVHASIHKDFNYQRLANWLDSVPMRWDHYRNVADANRAMRGGRK